MQLVPFIFQAQWGFNPNFLLIIFGVGLLQVPLTAPGGLADQVPRTSRGWRGCSARPFRKRSDAPGRRA